MSTTLQIQKHLDFTGHKGAIYTLSRSVGPGKFISGGGDGQVVEWDLHDPERARVIAQLDARVFSIRLIPEKNLLLVGNMEGGLYWIDLNEKKVLSSLAHHKNGIFDIKYLNGYIITLGGDGKLTKWSPDSMLPSETLHLSGHSLRGSNRYGETDLLAIGSSDNAIYLVDFEHMRMIDRIDDAHDNSVFTVKYSVNLKKLISGGRDAHLKVWDVEQHYKNIESHPAHWYTLNHLELIPPLGLVASASRDKTIKLWDLHTFDLLKVIDLQKNRGHINSVNRLLWLEEPGVLISGSDDRKIMAWDIKRTD